MTNDLGIRLIAFIRQLSNMSHTKGNVILRINYITFIDFELIGDASENPDLLKKNDDSKPNQIRYDRETLMKHSNYSELTSDMYEKLKDFPYFLGSKESDSTSSKICFWDKSSQDWRQRCQKRSDVQI